MVAQLWIAWGLGLKYNARMGEDTASRWFDQAKWDLKAARDSEAAGNYEWACFQAQQAAEKALKAFLLAVGSMPPLTHSIRTLLSE